MFCHSFFLLDVVHHSSRSKIGVMTEHHTSLVLGCKFLMAALFLFPVAMVEAAPVGLAIPVIISSCVEVLGWLYTFIVWRIHCLNCVALLCD